MSEQWRIEPTDFLSVMIVRRETSGVDFSVAKVYRVQDAERILAALAAAERVAGLEKILTMLADRFDLSSWDFEQRWGKSWHDATDAEMAAQIRAALAAPATAAAPTEPPRCEDCGARGHLECDQMPADGGDRYRG